MKTKTLIAMFLSGVLALSLTGCNDPIEKEPDIVEPGNGNGDDGNDDGGNDGGGNNDQIDPSTGTWENKDEDGDGVLDENDDFPFNGQLSQYPEIEEIEPNDNPSVAVQVTSDLPFKVKGVISDSGDNGDLYQFNATKGDYISARITYQSNEFKPRVYFSDQSGLVINSSEIHNHSALNMAHVLTKIPHSGKFNLSVIDDLSGGAPDYSYEIVVIQDNDTDGIDDHAEYAIGIEPSRIDTDGDSIHDFYEYYVKQGITLDEDNDGIINLLDLDSDGDGIEDKLEGAGNPDKDDRLNFLDLDSDNDGVPDVAEKKNIKGLPEDSDKDGDPDFSDLDNDGDKILDVYDASPYERAEGFRLSESPSIQIFSQYGYFNGKTEGRFYRVGDNISFTGEDFGELEQPKVVVYNGEEIYNINPTFHNSSELTFKFDVPFGKYKAFIYTGGKRSNEVLLSPYKAGSPLIFGYSKIKVQEGELYELRGAGFDSNTSIIMGNKTLVPSSYSESRLSFTVPSDITDGTLYLTNNIGASNKIRYEVASTIKISVKEANEFSNQLLVASNPMGIGAIPYVDGMDYHFDFTDGAKLHFFDKRSGYLTREFQVNLEIQSDNSYEYQIKNTRFDVALVKGQYTFNNYEESYASNTKASPLKYNKIRSSLSANNVSNTLNPNVTDYMDSYFNFTISATSRFENFAEVMNNCKEGESWRDILGYDGCVELQNRSQLYLSTRIYKTDEIGNLDLTSEKLNKPEMEHILYPWDSNMAGPINLTFLGVEIFAGDKLYDPKECIYKPCLYQVLTPGVGQQFGPSPFINNDSTPYNDVATEAKKALAIRTIIDNIMIRFFSVLLDQMGIDADAELYLDIAKVVYRDLPKVKEEVAKLMEMNNPKASDFEEAGKQILKQLYNNEIKTIYSENPHFGPVMTRILELVNLDPLEALGGFLEKQAEKAIPFYGQLKAAFELGQIASIVVDFGKTIHDFATVPEKTDFIVTWGLSIVDIDPRVVSKESGDQTITIYGVGFDIDEGFFRDRYPEFTFTDSNNRDHTYTVSKDAVINEEGNQATITLPETYINDAVGPIEVSVEHLDETAYSANNIEVTFGLVITEITPDEGKPSDVITIKGSGFSVEPRFNIVEFQSKNGRVEAIVESATSTELKVKVPVGAKTGDVTVRVGNNESNGLLFTIPFTITITYGDNGNHNDDVFKLKVGGNVVYDNDQPQRQIGPIEIALTQGVHKIELEGTKADDGIGTYYISFGGDVQSVSGDALEGRDLCPEVVKTYNVTVGPTLHRTSVKAVKMPIRLQAEQSGVATECQTSSNL